MKKNEVIRQIKRGFKKKIERKRFELRLTLT